ITLFDVIHPVHHERCQNTLRQIMAGEVIRTIETIFVTRDGRQLIVEGNINLRQRPNAAPTTRGIFRDVTHRRQLEADEHEQRILAEALRDTADALNSTLDFDEIMDRILTNVVRVVPHNSANIMLIESGVTRFVRIRDYTDIGLEQAMVNLRFIVAETPSFNQVYTTGKPLIISDVRKYEEWVDAPESNWIGSYAAVPIQREKQVIGFLNLNSTTPNFFTDALVDRLQAFSNQIALAVENARLYTQAKELAAAQERQRLAHELHDTINQTLFATSITAEALTRLAQDAPTSIQDGLSDVHRLTRRAMAGMRSLLLELRPTTLQQTSMEDLMRQITETFTGRSQVDIKLTSETDFSLPGDVKFALYRVTQETLDHIIKHSKATHATISLRHEGDGVELRINDNGGNFDQTPGTATYPTFTTINERIQSIGAHWQLKSQANKGTEVKVCWQPAPPVVN
ncbi:MAG TPA: histidine kinase, partial [Phototrophicaceae bacterium]|nr:histidine kinase [Phototrophicaceae bacterium]